MMHTDENCAARRNEFAVSERHFGMYFGWLLVHVSLYEKLTKAVVLLHAGTIERNGIARSGALL